MVEFDWYGKSWWMYFERDVQKCGEYPGGVFWVAEGDL
jgi:hypothetical protein